MMLPRVVGMEGMRVHDGPPPDHWTRHKWWRPLETERAPDVFIHKSAEQKIRNHATSQDEEVMGFLLGWVGAHDGEEYVVIRDVATTELQSSMVSVRFSDGGYERLFESLDDIRFDYVIVGWYHSHPGHTCFLSDVDVRTQEAIFNSRFHSALVIDPVNEELDVFHVVDGDVRRRSLAVYWDSYEDPYYGTSLRFRKVS